VGMSEIILATFRSDSINITISRVLDAYMRNRATKLYTASFIYLPYIYLLCKCHYTFA